MLDIFLSVRSSKLTYRGICCLVSLSLESRMKPQKNARYENVPCVKPYIMSDVQIIVIRLGLEPKTHTLKVYCSTS